jgi:hypothetical protein
VLLPKLPLPALQAEHAHPAHAVGLHAPLVIGVLVLARLPLALGAAEGLVRLVGHAERLRGGATLTRTPSADPSPGAQAPFPLPRSGVPRSDSRRHLVRPALEAYP